MTMLERPMDAGLEASLPYSWYLEDRIFEAERQHLFFKEWFCIGRVEDLDRAGGNMVVTPLGMSVIVVRTPRNEIKAFHNVCRHRGAELCVEAGAEERSGRADLKGGVVGKNLIRCAYHSWAYNFDGELVAAPHLAENAVFQKKDFPLRSVRIESWGGFLFLNFTPISEKTLADHLAPMTERIKRYPLAALKEGARIHYEVEANWKVIAENYNECYHCGGVHPELCQIVPAFKEHGGANLDWDKGIPHREGAYTFTTTGTTNRRAFPGLNEEELTHHKGELLYPNLFVSLASDHAACFLLTPKGPNRTDIDCIFLFEESEINAPHFNPSDAVDFWDLVNRQDWSICERVQRGMSRGTEKAGFYAPMEDWSLDIRRYVTDRIGAYL